MAKKRLICGRDCKLYGKECPYHDAIKYSDKAVDCPFFEPKRSSEKGEDEAIITVRTSSVVLDGKLYEEIYDPENNPPALFISLNEKGEVELYTEVSSETTKYVPYIPLGDNDPINTGAVKLPTFYEEYESEKKLVKQIQDHIHRYLDVSPRFERFASWYILLTWLYDKVNVLPYLRALGDTGTGKSRFLDVIGGLCYKPCMVSGAITPAPIYRMIKQWKGTIVLDEADFRDSSEKNEVITILNCGFEKGRPVIRCKQDNVETLQFLPTFSPKVIASRRPFKDVALESRCLTEKMIETSRKDIPDVLPQEFYDEQEELRNKLLLFRLRNYNKIDPNTSLNIDLGDVEPRLRQATRSFASLFANIPDILEDFKVFLREYNDELVEERSETLDGMIVNAIFSLKEDGYEEISSKDIADKLKVDYQMEKVTPQLIGRHLKSLGINTKHERKARLIEWDDKLMMKLAKRYIPSVTLTKLSYFNVTNVTNGTTQQRDVTSVTSVTTTMESQRKRHNLDSKIKKFVEEIQQLKDEDGFIDYDKALEVARRIPVSDPERFIHHLVEDKILIEPFLGRLEIARGGGVE
ncbi:MAG: hypothetical protein J7K13_00180 [Thermoplasmata archaeon]|nr:hypothetical protein [Thermoplasmata archaeon]